MDCTMINIISNESITKWNIFLILLIFLLILIFIIDYFYTKIIWDERKIFIKKQRFLILLVVSSLFTWVIMDNRYEIFMFFSWLLSFMIWKEVEIQLNENRKRDRFAARFRVLVSNYFISADSLLNATKAHPGQIVKYAKDYVNKKNLVFDFLEKEVDENLFLYNKLKDFSYVKENDPVNIEDKIWYFNDIFKDDIIPRNNSFYDELITKIETTKKIYYIKNNEIINTQVDVIKKISEHLGIDLESS